VTWLTQRPTSALLPCDVFAATVYDGLRWLGSLQNLPDVPPGRVTYAGILLSLSLVIDVVQYIGVKPCVFNLQNHSPGISPRTLEHRQA
jgi:hypothetical protein